MKSFFVGLVAVLIVISFDARAATNDHFTALIPLSGWTATSTVNPAGSQTQDGDPYAPNSGLPNQVISLWWSYTAPADGEVSVSISSPTISIEVPGKVTLYLYAATPAPNKTQIATSNFFAIENGSNSVGISRALLGIDGRFMATAGTTYYIEVDVDSLNYGEPITITAATAIGQTGWYWQGSTASGTGYAIEFRGGNVFAGFFLYNSDGTPVWYVANGPLVNGTTFTAPLQRFSGGQSILNAQSPGQAAHYADSPGSVTIVWSAAGVATMTWPGGTVPIQRYIFDPGTGWANTGKPTNYHNTGWYWLPQNGGGIGLFGEAQGSSEFWVAFNYDGAGNPTWDIAAISGLITSGPGMASGAGNHFANNLVAYTGGQTLIGPWQQATMTSTLVQTNFASGNGIFVNFTTAMATYSTLGAAVYTGPSTNIAYSNVVLYGITEPVGVSVLLPSNFTTISVGPNASAYQTLCGGSCVWQRFQF